MLVASAWLTARNMSGGGDMHTIVSQIFVQSARMVQTNMHFFAFAVSSLIHMLPDIVLSACSQRVASNVVYDVCVSCYAAVACSRRALAAALAAGSAEIVSKKEVKQYKYVRISLVVMHHWADCC